MRSGMEGIGVLFFSTDSGMLCCTLLNETLLRHITLSKSLIATLNGYFI